MSVSSVITSFHSCFHLAVICYIYRLKEFVSALERGDSCLVMNS